MAHDFRKFPELTNSQMDFYYFDSPHKQIFENFQAEVIKVVDGDTIKVRWRERDFDFPIRFMNIQAPEKKDSGGLESKAWLEALLLGQNVEIGINPELRVEKWGRLLGYVSLGGIDVGEESVTFGHAKPWAMRNDGLILDFDKQMKGSEIR